MKFVRDGYEEEYKPEKHRASWHRLCAVVNAKPAPHCVESFC